MARDLVLDRFVRHAQRAPSRPALYAQPKPDAPWQALDWGAFLSRARSFAKALLSHGYKPGEAVAIVGENRPEWVLADVGAMLARGVPAGIYQTSTAEQVAYVVEHSEARVVVLDSRAQLTKLLSQSAKLGRVEVLVMTREVDTTADPRVVSFEDFLSRGADLDAELDARFASIVPEDLATLIYTSGTTGPPKAAMLSHRNWAAASDAAMRVVSLSTEDVVLSYLPLSHVAEQMFTIQLPLSSGATVYFCDRMDKLREALPLARPTVFLAVPRVWEKFRAALEHRFHGAPPAQRRILSWARAALHKAGEYKLRGAPLPLHVALQASLAQRLFGQKLATGLGLDRLRCAVTGAAPIGRDVLDFFLSVGIPIHEVYGQTEGSGVATFNRPRRVRLGTVGEALPLTELRIAPDGELLVRGPTVFLGYFKDAEATAATLKDGWLYTGDVATVDSDGYYRITDRKKDLLITSGGKNVAPQNLEKLLRAIPGISQAVVLGDRRKYLTALLTLEPEKARELAAEKGWPTDTSSLSRHPGFRALLQQAIDDVNGQLARYESIKNFALLPDDFTQESGELTPTQKIKRRVVLEKYASVIEALYASESEQN